MINFTADTLLVMIDSNAPDGFASGLLSSNLLRRIQHTSLRYSAWSKSVLQVWEASTHRGVSNPTISALELSARPPQRSRHDRALRLPARPYTSTPISSVLGPLFDDRAIHPGRNSCFRSRSCTWKSPGQLPTAGRRTDFPCSFRSTRFPTL